MTLVIFDLDNTLTDRTTAFDRWGAELCGKYGIADPDAREWLRDADEDGMRDRLDFLREVVRRYGLPHEPGQLLSEYFEAIARNTVCLPETRQALQRCRDTGLLIGIATNGWPTQHLKIHRARLAEIVHGIGVSSLVGSAKPEVGILEEVARRCGCTLDDGWMVGDTAEADILGGVNASLGTVWIHRGRTWKEASFRPDHEAASVSEAVDLILGDSRGRLGTSGQQSAASPGTGDGSRLGL